MKIDFERVAQSIYEATRLEARWSKRSIVPEKWEDRDKNFRRQFIDIVKKYIKLDELPTPKEAHDSWWREYKKMGWEYGEVRDLQRKFHPDMIPFDNLPKDERDKDAIFLILIFLTKKLTSFY